MAYCVHGDVRAICDTDITDAEIDTLIDESDDILDLMLNMGGLSVNVRRRLSRVYTALTCFMKDPDAMSLGELRYDRAATLKKLNEEFDRLVRIAGGGMSFVYDYAEMPRDPA